MTIAMVIWTLLLLFFSCLPSVFAQTQALQFLNKPSPHKPQHFSYDSSGILTIDGTVPGMSDPITLGAGPVPENCFPKQHYIITFCPKDKQSFKDKKKTCEEGIYFCYESQLTKENARKHFVLSKIDHFHDFKKKCDLFSGFKVAMHHLPKDKKEEEKNDEDEETRAPHDLYLEVQTSYMDVGVTYYFPMPNTDCLELWLGNNDDLMTSVRSGDKMVRPVEVLRNGQYDGYKKEKEDGKSMRQLMEEDFQSIPDFKNMQRLDTKRHLNLLFLDFRAEYPKLQQLFTVAPEDGECNMIVRLRTNTGKGTCKADFKQKNFALRAYAWGNTTYSLTIVSGYEQSRTTGSSTSQSSEQSSATETGKQTTDETTQMSALQQQSESVHEVQDSSSSSSSEQTSYGGKVKAGAEGTYKGVTGKVEVGAEYNRNFGSSESISEIHGRKSSSSTMDYNSQSTASVLTSAYTHTATITNIAKTKTTSSQTVGVSSRTVFKWTVTVPPGKILTPMQMQMNCDGKPVKIPWIKFLLQGEGDREPVKEYD